MREKSVRKFFFVILFVFLSLFCFAQEEIGSDFRLKSMGNVGVAENNAKGSFFRNPASLFFHNKKDTFSFSFGYSDMLPYAGSSPFPVLPSANINLRFVGTNLSAALFFYNSVSVEETEELFEMMTAESVLSSDFCFSIGWQFFSVGLGISTGSQWVRENFCVYNENRLSQLFLNTVTGEYRKLDEGQFFNLRTGLQLNYSNITLGLLVPNTYSYTNGESFFSFEEIEKNICLGFSYSGNEYGRRGHLHFIVFRIDAEVQNIFADKRIYKIGTEISLQFVTEHILFLRAGYESQAEQVFSPNIVTLGTGLRLGILNMDFFAELPLQNSYNKYGIRVGIMH